MCFRKTWFPGFRSTHALLISSALAALQQGQSSFVQVMTWVMNSFFDGRDRSGLGNLGFGTCETFAQNDDAYAKKRHVFEQELANRIDPGEAAKLGVPDR